MVKGEREGEYEVFYLKNKVVFMKFDGWDSFNNIGKFLELVCVLIKNIFCLRFFFK